MKQEKLQEIFGRFVGLEVPMVEKYNTMAGQTLIFAEPEKDIDPVLKEMKDLAKENGLIMRFHWQGIFHPVYYRNDRVNASIEKGADNKWRVADKFTIG